MANSLLKELLQPSVEQHEEVTAPEFGIDTVEYASVEMNDAAQEVEQHINAVDELETIFAGLESIEESMTASIEHGGMDPVAAQFAHHAVGAYTERLGIEAADQLPSLEAFGGDTGRQTSTQVSIEGAKETMARIFEAIRRAIEAVIKAVTDFFTKLFSNAEKLEKSIDATLKKVQDEKGSPKEKTRVPNADTLVYDGKLDAASVATGIEKTGSAYTAMSTKYITAVTKGQNELIDSLKDSSKLEIKEDDREEWLKAFDEKVTYITKTSKGLESQLKGQFSGGYEVSFKAEGEGDDQTVTVSVARAEDFKKVEDNTIDTPNATDLAKVLTAAKGVAGAIKDSKKTIDDAVKNYREVNKGVKDVQDAAKKDSDGTIAKFLNGAKAKRALKTASKDMVRPAQKLAQHGWQVSRSAIAYAEASLKNYETK